MRDLSDTTGSFGYGEAPGEAGDFTTPSSGKAFYQELISKANTVPIARIFKYYGLRISEVQRNVTCPLKSHKGGKENTASFWYYPETNSFYCYGCKVGGPHCHGSEFIAAMEGISRAKAARKILELFGSDVDPDAIFDQESFSEKIEIMMDFSNTVRNFRHEHIDDKSQKFIENICSVYDSLNLKHKTLNNEALRSIVDQLKDEINIYKSCHTL